MRFSIGVASLLSLFSFDVCAVSLNATNELIERLFKDYNAQASPYAANISASLSCPTFVCFVHIFRSQIVSETHQAFKQFLFGFRVQLSPVWWVVRNYLRKQMKWVSWVTKRSRKEPSHGNSRGNQTSLQNERDWTISIFLTANYVSLSFFIHSSIISNITENGYGSV